MAPNLGAAPSAASNSSVAPNPSAAPKPSAASNPGAAPTPGASSNPPAKMSAAQKAAAELAAKQQVAKQPAVKPAPAVQPAPPAPTIALPAPTAPTAVDGDNPELFALIRRIALQTDFTNAAAVLHAGLGELLSSRVALALVSARGEISSPVPADLRDAAVEVPIAAIANAAATRQIVGADRYIAIPVIASVPAILVVWRPATAPVLDPNVANIAIAAASRLAILDHYLAAQAQQQTQAAADANSVFRTEALVASRSKNRVGDLVNLSPRWVRIALPTVLILGIVLIAVAAIIQVPSYSRGVVVVRMNGHNVISNAQGRISKILVASGQQVAAGQQLIELDSTLEQQAFAQVDTVYRDQLGAFLVDPTDETARQSLAGIIASHTSAKETLATKIITAPIDGVVGAILSSDTVSAGEHVLTIIPEGSEPSVIAFMPGFDLARIKVGMILQVEMTGYSHKRLELSINEVGDEVISQTQARKQLGQKLADAVALPPSTVMIKAKLTSTSFDARGETYRFRDGMDGIGEIAVDTKSLLSMIINRGD